MKLCIILLFTLFTSAVWQSDFTAAKIEAAKSNKMILVNFSGSDWCLPCIQLKKKFFDSEIFNSYADKNLVLVNADFPRQKKHKLSSQQKQMNEDLAERFNPDGKFPYTILLTADGKIVKQWDGLPDETSSQFVEEVNHFADAGK